MRITQSMQLIAQCSGHHNSRSNWQSQKRTQSQGTSNIACETTMEYRSYNYTRCMECHCMVVGWFDKRALSDPRHSMTWQSVGLSL